MDDYITKPFLPEKVFEVLRQFAGKPKQREKAADAPPEVMDKEKGGGPHPAEPEAIKKYLVKMYGMTPGKINDMMAAFAHSLTTNMEAAEKAIAEQDMASIAMAAHAIKGGLLNAGLKDWADCAHRMEITAESKENMDYKARLSELRAGLGPIMNLDS